MPPSSLSPAAALLQQYLRVSGDLQVVRSEPWFKGDLKDGLLVSADVMLHAEDILRAAYTGPPTFSQPKQFLSYALDLRDRNSVYECFAVLAGAYYSYNRQQEYYSQLEAAYTDNALTTLLAGVVAVAQLMRHGEGDGRGQLLLSYISTTPVLFRWAAIPLPVARNQRRLVALVEKALDDGESLSYRQLAALDRRLQKDAKQAAQVAPVQEEKQDEAANAQETEHVSDEAEEAEEEADESEEEAEKADDEQQGADDEQQDEGMDDEQDEGMEEEQESKYDGQEDSQEDATAMDEEKGERGDEADERPRKRQRQQQPVLAQPQPPRVKPGFSFRQRGPGGRPYGFQSKMRQLLDGVREALQQREPHDAQYWTRRVRAEQRAEPARWTDVGAALFSAARQQLAGIPSRARFDAAVALCSAVIDVHSERLRLWELCCGTGAFSVAFHQACEELSLPGETCLALDNEPRCISAVQHNQLSLQNEVADIHEYDFGTLPPADVVACGIPCPAYSRMPQVRLGTTEDDPIHALFRLAKADNRPRAFVLECVDGMKVGHPEDFAALLQEFTDAGYHCWHAVFNSADFGLAQDRKRLFMAFFREQVDWERFQPPEPPEPHEKVDFRTVLLEPDEDDPCWISHLETNRFPGTDQGLNGDEPVSVRDAQRPGEMYNHDQQHPGDEWRRCETTAPCLLKSWDHPTNRPVILDGDNWRLLKSRELARLQGFPEWYGWPDLRDRRDRKEENQALIGSRGKGKGLTQENAECRMLGNAVSIPVAQAVMRAVLQAFALPEPEAMDDAGGL